MKIKNKFKIGQLVTAYYDNREVHTAIDSITVHRGIGEDHYLRYGVEGEEGLTLAEDDLIKRKPSIKRLQDGGDCVYCDASGSIKQTYGPGLSTTKHGHAWLTGYYCEDCETTTQVKQGVPPRD